MTSFQYPTTRFARGIVVALALSTSMVTACSNDDDDSSARTDADSGTLPLSAQSTTFVAAVPGTDAYFAVTTDGTRLRAYLCDGVSTSVWLAGSLDQDGAFHGESEGVAVNLTVDGSELVADVTTADGESHEVTAASVTPDRAAGLYRGESDLGSGTVLGGWIVLPDGSVRGYVEQDNIGVPFQPRGSQLVQQLTSRGSVTLTVGTLRITDGTSNIVR